MSGASVPKTTQVNIRVPDEVLAQIDEVATLMQRPRRFVVVQALARLYRCRTGGRAQRCAGGC